MTDAQLLSDFIHQRSPDAFSVLVKRHLPLVHATARRILGNSPLADDVAQATFILLARKARAINPLHLPGWLVNTARLAARQTLRNETTREKHESRAAQLRTSSSPEPQDSTIHHLTPLLDDALAKLPEIDRTAIILRFFNGLPFADVGRSLNISEEAARKRTRRALHKLRTRLLRHTPHLSIDALALTLAANQSPPPTDSLLASFSTNPFTISPTTPAATIARQVLLAAQFKLLAMIAAAIALIALPAFLILHTVATTPVAAAIPPSPPPAPATVPTVTPALTRIRAELYLLRYSAITSVTTDETYTAIRELVSLAQTDRSVVPELAAELDHATSDSELRALAFTLRAINDPRAIPALIRALPKTSVLSSDFGTLVYDHDLWQFITSHPLSTDPPKAYPDIDIPRAVEEIAAALETITHHTGTKPATDGARNNSPGELARARTRRQAEANRWQNWWNDHAQEFLTHADLDSLALHLSNHDPVEAAGLATCPLFPTGPQIHLGPAHDLILPPPQSLYDTPAYMNLATGRTFTFLENVSHPNDALLSSEPWMRESQIDIFTGEAVLNAHRVGNTNGITWTNPQYFYGLSTLTTRVWPIDNARWDTLDAELHRPSPLNLGQRGPYGDFYPRDPDTDELHPTGYPATFLFLTAHHTRGILQLLDSSDTPPGIHFRYRLIEGITTTEPAPPFPTPTPRPELAFSPEKTVTLAAPTSHDPSALDLDTGLSRPADPVILNRSDPSNLSLATTHWLEGWHGDIVAEPADRNDHELYALWCADMAIFPCTTLAYEKLSPTEVASIATRRPASTNPTFIYTDHEQQSPATWVFKTREGAIGLLQITAATPTTLTLRYKLVTPK